jgi:hypothetical protein
MADPAINTLPPASGLKRRVRFAALSLILVLVGAVSVVMLNVLASTFSVRLDVTATKEQELAPRTKRLLDGLKGPHKIVIATRLPGVDRRVRERVLDLLAEMQRATPNLTTSVIDTSSPAGLEEYRTLVRDLVQRDQDRLRQQRDTIDLAITNINSLAVYLDQALSPALQGVQEAISPATTAGLQNRQFFEQTAAAARINARELRRAATRASEQLTEKVEDIVVPATDKAASIIVETMAPVADQLAALSKEVKRFVEAGGSDPSVDLARPLVGELEKRRDGAAIIADPLARMPRLDVLRVIDALRSASAALVIGPEESGLTAIDVNDLFPSAAWLDATRLTSIDLGRRAEELLSTAIASLSGTPKPIVVFVHGETRPFLERATLITDLSRQLRMRGMDIIEWAPLADPEAPGLARLNADPTRKRPVVYVTISPDSTQAAAPGEPTGIQRASALGQVLSRLAEQGENLLVSLNPSVAPTYGDPDPTTTFLKRWGIEPITGQCILREQASTETPSGRFVSTDFVIQPAEETGHLISGAIRGLPTAFIWPIQLNNGDISGGGRVTRTDLYTITPDERTWGESQWMEYWRTRPELRAQLPKPPSFDAGRDTRAPQTLPGAKPHPWVVACAAERFEGGTKQRVVVVGTNGWFLDRVTGRMAQVNGRPTVINPGNLELFEASVSWLAGLDEFIAQSPSARTLSVVNKIDDGRLTTLRVALIAGMPLVVLVLGALYRLIRG